MESVTDGQSILIVDDDHSVRSYISEVLTEMGYVVAGCVSSRVEAVAVAERARPTVAFVDLDLDEPFGGVELAADLKERLDVSVVFLADTADPWAIKQALAAHPSGFVRKPFAPSQMLRPLERAISSAALRRVSLDWLS